MVGNAYLAYHRLQYIALHRICAAQNSTSYHAYTGGGRGRRAALSIDRLIVFCVRGSASGCHGAWQTALMLAACRGGRDGGDEAYVFLPSIDPLPLVARVFAIYPMDLVEEQWLGL